ncbi:MAG: hypothetical protein ACRDOB_00820, partial [Streptosporangiaceae bacterium]
MRSRAGPPPSRGPLPQPRPIVPVPDRRSQPRPGDRPRPDDDRSPDWFRDDGCSAPVARASGLHPSS